jgi:hypothetical protein
VGCGCLVVVKNKNASGRAHVGGSRGIFRSSQILTNNTLV